MIPDTGGLETAVDAYTVRQFVSRVDGAIKFDDIGWSFPCDSPLPALEFVFPTGSIEIPGKHFNGAQLVTASHQY